MSEPRSRRTRLASSTARGLGWRHQQAVAALKRAHRDGSSCQWCGRPMWLDERKNWDYDAAVPGSGKLHGDHGHITRAEALRRGIPIPLPDRLLHARCNQQRGDGVNDHLAATNRKTAGPATTEKLVFPWPWLT